MVSGWNPGGEEESRIAAHFMMVGKDIRFPFMVFSNPGLRFGMLKGQPVSIQVEPVMIGPSPGPYLIVFSVIRVRAWIFSFIGICPGGKPLKTIRIDGGVNQDDGILKYIINFTALSRLPSDKQLISWNCCPRVHSHERCDPTKRPRA